jgi:hypothetical protein
MSNREVATLHFTDSDSNDEAVAVVRTCGGSIALALSLEHGADVEVVPTPRDCERLLAALRNALSATAVPQR